jgi:hypothetical protein
MAGKKKSKKLEQSTGDVPLGPAAQAPAPALAPAPAPQPQQ